MLEGLDAALERRKRSRERARVLDGEAEAQLLAIACSEPPEGCARWTLHLLVEELQGRRIVASVSHETVRQVLKKRRQTLAAADVVHSAQAGHAAFVCAMEQVLDGVQRARMTRCIRWCAWTRRPSNASRKRARRNRPRRVARRVTTPNTNATAWRTCITRRWKIGAGWIRESQSCRYHLGARHAPTGGGGLCRRPSHDILVMDNLNTHAGASLYKAFPAPQARRLEEASVRVHAQARQVG